MKIFPSSVSAVNTNTKEICMIKFIKKILFGTSAEPVTAPVNDTVNTVVNSAIGLDPMANSIVSYIEPAKSVVKPVQARKPYRGNKPKAKPTTASGAKPKTAKKK